MNKQTSMRSASKAGCFSFNICQDPWINSGSGGI